MTTRVSIKIASILVVGSLAFAATLSPSAAAGKKTYNQFCASCHGVKAEGGVGPLLKGEVAGWKYADFKKAVLLGVDDKGKKLTPMMPRWGKTGFGGKKANDALVKGIQAYLKTFK